MSTMAIRHTVTWTHADTGETQEIDYVTARHDRGNRAVGRSNEARTDAHERRLADYSLACDQGKAIAVTVTREPVVITDPDRARPT